MKLESDKLVVCGISANTVAANILRSSFCSNRRYVWRLLSTDVMRLRRTAADGDDLIQLLECQMRVARPGTRTALLAGHVNETDECNCRHQAKWSG